nr:hypothetical protein CFP56_21074 [Quercus suber]
MSSSSSDNSKTPSNADRGRPSLRLKNTNVARYRAANNEALGLLATGSDVSSFTSSEPVAHLNDNTSSNYDTLSSPSETSDTSNISDISNASIAAHVAAIDAAHNKATTSSSLAARRKGKAPASIDTAIATATHPDLNSDGDAPPSIESLSPQIPPSGAPSFDSSSSSSSTPELSPTPPPEWLQVPYYPSKRTQQADGSFVSEGPPAIDTAVYSWYFYPSRHTTGFTTMATHMANAIIPSQAAYAALQAIFAAQQALVVGSSTARPFVAANHAGLPLQTSTERILIPAAQIFTPAQVPVAVMLSSAAVPSAANAPQVLAPATIPSTAAQTVNAPQVPVSTTLRSTVQASTTHQNTTSTTSAATTTVPVAASNGLLNNGSSVATDATDPSTNTFAVLSVTHFPGSTSVKPEVDPENPIDYLDVPWKCANRNCNTGQTWLDRNKVGRKCTSDFFGKNKNTTRDIPPEVWHWMCRKEYQRKGNRLTKYSQDYQLWKLDHARIQFLRIGLWRPEATFTIRLTDAMIKRLAAFHTITRRNGADRDAALAELDDGKEFKVHKKNKMQLLPPEMACPMDVAEYFEANYRQMGASIPVCLTVMDWMVAVASSRSLANDLPVEFLMDKVREGETLRDPNDNYRQWISFEDRLIANALAEGIDPSPDHTYAAILSRHHGNARTTTTTQTSAETATAVAASRATPATVAVAANADTPMPDITADNIDVQAVKGLLYLTGQYLDLPTDRIERALAAASTQAAVTGDLGAALDYQHTAGVHLAAAQSIAGSMSPVPGGASGLKRKRSAPSTPEPDLSSRRLRQE